MPGKPSNLDSIAANMRDCVQRYANTVAGELGSTLKSIVMFGRVVGSQFDRESYSALSAIVLDAIDLPCLRRLADRGDALGKDSIAAPIVMTPAYIQASLDTFPLELLEIQQRHATVFGQDYFANLAFEEPHVRLQCERELKRILMGMRHALLASAGRTKLIEPLERDAGDTLLRTVYGLLWLRGQKQPLRPMEVVDQAERQFERKLPGLRSALDENAHIGWEEFDALYRDVDSLGEMVNAW